MKKEAKNFYPLVPRDPPEAFLRSNACGGEDWTH
jgi:hypothetical protein